MSRLIRLADVTYTMAKEAIAFVKFPELAAMLRRAGVSLGETYMNDKFAQELTIIFGELIAGDINDMLKPAYFFSILVDGSTDTSVKEKELLYARFISADGRGKCPNTGRLIRWDMTKLLNIR
jgi:hypothetical protein